MTGRRLAPDMPPDMAPPSEPPPAGGRSVASRRSTGRPLVAVTTTFDEADGFHAQPYVHLYSAYIRALEQVGLASVLITPFHSAPTVHALLERCSGLMLTGGGDIDPSRYGDAPHPTLEYVAPARDEMESRVLARALERGMPVLAVCRGAHLMNVQFGGTLWQDIPSQVPTELEHNQAAPWGERCHDIRVQLDSRLGSVVETETLAINSFHHQAIKDVAPGLEVTAVAPDGLIECVEATAYPWVVGVQWHPERQEEQAPETDPDRRLLAAFGDVVLEFCNG